MPIDVLLQFILTVDTQVSLLIKVVTGLTKPASESAKGFPVFRPSLRQR
jgi:hypothetical protein